MSQDKERFLEEKRKWYDNSKGWKALLQGNSNEEFAQVLLRKVDEDEA